MAAGFALIAPIPISVTFGTIEAGALTTIAAH